MPCFGPHWPPAPLLSPTGPEQGRAGRRAGSPRVGPGSDGASAPGADWGRGGVAVVQGGGAPRLWKVPASRAPQSSGRRGGSVGRSVPQNRRRGDGRPGSVSRGRAEGRSAAGAAPALGRGARRPGPGGAQGQAMLEAAPLPEPQRPAQLSPDPGRSPAAPRGARPPSHAEQGGWRGPSGARTQWGACAEPRWLPGAPRPAEAVAEGEGSPSCGPEAACRDGSSGLSPRLPPPEQAVGAGSCP